jgi:hypothetical protein
VKTTLKTSVVIVVKTTLETSVVIVVKTTLETSVVIVVKTTLETSVVIEVKTTLETSVVIRFAITCVGASGKSVSDPLSPVEFVLQGCGSYDEEDHAPAVDPRLLGELNSGLSTVRVFLNFAKLTSQTRSKHVHFFSK